MEHSTRGGATDEVPSPSYPSARLGRHMGSCRPCGLIGSSPPSTPPVLARCCQRWLCFISTAALRDAVLRFTSDWTTPKADGGSPACLDFLLGRAWNST